MSNNPFSSLVRKDGEQLQLSPTEARTLNGLTNQMDNQTQSVHHDSLPYHNSLEYVSPRTTYNDESSIQMSDNSFKNVNGYQYSSSETNQLSSSVPLNTCKSYVYKSEGYPKKRLPDISRLSSNSLDMKRATNSDSSNLTPKMDNQNDISKRISNLDPGSISTVSNKQFFGENANSTLPSRNRSVLRSNQSSYKKRLSTSGSSNINLTTDISPNNQPMNMKTASQIQSPAPEIFVTDADNTTGSAPELPPKPSLPSRPPLPPRNQSAHELLHNYSRTLLSDSQAISSNPALNSNTTSHDLLSGIDDFEGVIITEDIIKQQKEIEESIRRRHQDQHSTALLPDATIKNGFVSNDTSFASTSNEDDISIDSSNPDDDSLSRDVSQLEIPSGLCRSNSNCSDTESDAGSSIILVDMFATGDITEEEFISLLPPVPEYTKIPRETELSIPNGKAIDILQINEKHSQEPPPDYTPLTHAMKELIRRPQFSQTGGDSQTYSRRQQQQIQQIERRMQQQEHMSAYYDLPSQREDSPEDRNRLYFDTPPLPLRPIFYGARGIVLTDRNPRVRRVYPLNTFTSMYRRY